MTGDIEKLQAQAGTLRDSITQAFLGKEEAVEMVLVALLARGHVLLEDVPGVGKTTLARSAACLSLSFRRIQFTSDLLPADVVGVSIYREAEGLSSFKRACSLRTSFSLMKSTEPLRGPNQHCLRP